MLEEDRGRSKRRKPSASRLSFGQDRERGARSLATQLGGSYENTVGGVKTEIPDKTEFPAKVVRVGL